MRMGNVKQQWPRNRESCSLLVDGGPESHGSYLDYDAAMKGCWAWAAPLMRWQGHCRTGLDRVQGSLHRKNRAGELDCALGSLDRVDHMLEHIQGAAHLLDLT